MNDGLRVVVLSVFITLVLTSAAMAAVTDFEGFTTGTSVNGQGGWSVEDSFGHDNADSGKPAYEKPLRMTAPGTPRGGCRMP